MGRLNWEVKILDLSELKPLSYNPRDITEKGLNDLKDSIKKFGIAEPIVVNTDKTIIGGHARYHALTQIGEKEVQCYIPERPLTKKEIDELNIRLNKNIAGKWDFDILANDFELDDLLEWGFDEQELDINLWNEIDEEKLDEVPEAPKEALSKLGDIFAIDGKHRVMCGDSTKKVDVEKLMDGKKADMVFTDPPYNVDYEGGLSADGKGGLKSNGRDKLINDDVDIYPLVIPLLAKHCEGAIYTWFAGTKAETIYSTIKDYGQIHALIIWVKNGGYGALNANYKQKHEPCLYWKGKNGKLNFNGSTTETTVWEINKDGKNKLHPTQKPVSLAEKAIKNHSAKTILDLFLGSGSTLIAAEQTNRICYGMELDPIYIDVILRRYKNLYPNAEIKCLNREFDFDKLWQDQENK